MRSGGKTSAGRTAASARTRRIWSRRSLSSGDIDRGQSRYPYWSDRHPDHVAASALLTEAVFNSGLRRYQADGEAWKAEWICYYFINDSAPPSFVVDVSDYYAAEARGARLPHQSVPARRAGVAAATRLNTPLFRQLIESRDAQFGALAGVTWAEGFVVREPLMRASLMKAAR